MPIRRLTRSRANRAIAGVCAGLADYLGVDVVLVRAAWIVFSIFPGALIGGVIAYLAAWIVMPESTEPTPPQVPRLTRSTTDLKIAGVCGGLAEYFGVDATPIRLIWIVVSVVGCAVIGGVIAYLIAWLLIPRRPDVIVATPATAAP